jgi:hypothetical protein
MPFTKAILKKLDSGLDNPARTVFQMFSSKNKSFIWGVITGIFGILNSSAKQWYQDAASN